MTEDRTKKILKKLVIVLPMLLIIFASHSWAYKEDTHEAINSYIADRNSTLNRFSLHNYLQSQLGMQGGVETSFNNKQIFEWTKDGGDSEDNSLRYINHFYNPLTKKGYEYGSVNWFLKLLGICPRPSLDWALMSIGTQGMEGNYSWNDARYYYFWALVADGQNMQGQYFAETFRALGQLMHLVEDMSSPAHTRNDSHAFGDGYEIWAKKNVRQVDPNNPSILLFLGTYFQPSNSVFFRPSDSVTVSNLFDTNQYTGSNPAITLQTYIGLSEYTNANFFSDGTIDPTIFPSPQIDIAQTAIRPYTSQSGTYNRQYYLRNGYLLAAVDYYDYWRLTNPNPRNDLPVIPTLDDNVYSDYAQFLIPRAVGYSSQLLSYFFRGQMSVKEMPVFDAQNQKLQKLYVKVKNTTPTHETMFGDGQSSCFMLSWHYTPSSGSGEIWGRYPYCVLLPNSLPYGKDPTGGKDYEQLIIFDKLDQIQDSPILKEDYLTVEFMLTYIGDLGDEKMLRSSTPGEVLISGGVIGKYFMPAGSILFDEEWITTPKGDNGWQLAHDSAGGIGDMFASAVCWEFWCPRDNPDFGPNCQSWCPITCIDKFGTATDSVIGGSLDMYNIIHQEICGSGLSHCNASLIGKDFPEYTGGLSYCTDCYVLSGDKYNPVNSGANKYIFPIPVNENTYIQLSINDMSMGPTFPVQYAANQTENAYQIVTFHFNYGYVLQFSVAGQFHFYNTSIYPYVGYFYVDTDYINVDNIYDLFKQAGLPTPAHDLQLNYIYIRQSILDYGLPCNTIYTQHMSVDLIRVGEIVGPSSP